MLYKQPSFYCMYSSQPFIDQVSVYLWVQLSKHLMNNTHIIYYICTYTRLSVPGYIMHRYTITPDHRHHLELDTVYFSVWQVYHICVIILHCVRKWQWYCTTIQNVQLYCTIYKNSILYTNTKCTLDKSNLRLVEYIYNIYIYIHIQNVQWCFTYCT